MRQRLDDRAGIRQLVVEAEVPGYWTTRMPRSMQNPNREKIDMCDERLCDGAKNGMECMRVAGVCAYCTSPLCIGKDDMCVAGV